VIRPEAQLHGRRLAPGERFRFRCHRELACFNRCCRDKHLPLYPYDALRLRRAAGVSSARLLAEHAELELDPSSGWPVVRIKLAADGRCPFVTATGCGVYEHRPTCCRIYPLARAIAPGPRGEPPTELLLVTEPPGCLGWGEPREITTEQWRDEQGLADYQRANERMLELLFHPARREPMALSDRQLHAYVMGLYNLDVLREAWSDARRARACGLDAAALTAATSDAAGADEALLALGIAWVVRELFGC
jgi:hypothetical protein